MPREIRSLIAQVKYLNDDGSEMDDEQRELYLKEREERKKKEEEAHKARIKKMEYEVSIDGQIENLIGTREKLNKELNALYALKALYPDIRKHTNRWNRIRQCSKSVNSKVTDFEYAYSCDCCSDAAVDIWPYLETSFGKVYSDPPSFCVGEKTYGESDRERKGWESYMIKHGIPNDIIEKVAKRLKTGEDEAEEKTEEDSQEEDY